MGPGHPAGGVANPAGLGGQILGPQLQSLPPFGPSMPDHGQRQAISVGLGAASDGSMPVVKLRGLPFDTEVGEINRFLVRPWRVMLSGLNCRQKLVLQTLL